MANIMGIDRSLVAIVDLEGYSKKSPPEQAKLVQLFVELLVKQLRLLKDLSPDAFSTGDGAIISVGRNCKIDSSSLERFMAVIISFAIDLARNGLPVRTAVNYSEDDKVLLLGEKSGIDGTYIQVGDTINFAARMLTFCEPMEIMVSDAVFTLIRRNGLEAKWMFHKNEPVITKHEEILLTYTFVPSEGDAEYLYGPGSPIHPFKKFSNFPPIKAPTLQFFLSHGLDGELTRVVSNAYEAMRHINETMTFMSWKPVLNILMALRYDPEDEVYVFSRNDHSTGFWTQSRKNQYVGYLRANAGRYGGFVNQLRVLVYDDSKVDHPEMALPSETMPEDDICRQLEPLHRSGSFFSFPKGGLDPYKKLSALRFGFTLSTKHKYAIIPIPAPEDIDAHRLDPARIEDLLDRYSDYDMADGPKKAIITADHNYVSSLIKEMRILLEDTRKYRIK